MKPVEIALVRYWVCATEGESRFRSPRAVRLAAVERRSNAQETDCQRALGGNRVSRGYFKARGEGVKNVTPGTGYGVGPFP